MFTEYFAQLYSYDNEMNGEVLAQLRGLENVDQKRRKIFSHLLQAKKLWMWRMRGDDYKSLVIWPELSWEECEGLILENGRDWKEFVEGLSEEDLAREVVYTNSKGTEFRTAIRDILTHVLIHGGYHRGQVALAVRQAGEEPLVTDYIFWTRRA